MGVGAGMAYLYLKKASFSTSIEDAKKEFENRHNQQPADGEFSVGDIKNLHEATTGKVVDKPANRELSKTDQYKLNSQGGVLTAEQLEYDSGGCGPPEITGIYMEQHVPQI